jgi:glycerol-3-phosphate acyltransferase PlsY
MFVMIGHNWPLLLRFEGGKGLAATAGLVHFSLVFIRHYPGLKKGKMLIT